MTDTPPPPPAAQSSLRACPRCAESIQSAALACRYCGARLGGGQGWPTYALWFVVPVVLTVALGETVAPGFKQQPLTPVAHAWALLAIGSWIARRRYTGMLKWLRWCAVPLAILLTLMGAASAAGTDTSAAADRELAACLRDAGDERASSPGFANAPIEDIVEQAREQREATKQLQRGARLDCYAAHLARE